MASSDAKKPRHRHAPHQLVALNELYEQTEHPTLEQRTALAEHLGMETKTVNSWFQNKRASSKKRTKAPLTHCELPPISALIASVSAPPVHRAPQQQHTHSHSHTYAHGAVEYDELSDDEESGYPPHPLSYHGHPHPHPHALHPSLAGRGLQHQLFYAEAHPSPSESEVPRKGRARPSAAQTVELKKLYAKKAHPSKEEREALGTKIGMRYQSVTNWFQNQRSIAKKREETAAFRAVRANTPFAVPPSSSAAHPSLIGAVPPPTSHPSLAALLHGGPPRARRSPSAAPSLSAAGSRPPSPRASPYPLSTADRAMHMELQHRRPRRTRPEPWQLEALKKLFGRTKTPSIEDRQTLAAEIGMDVGKVTNWFRNLRQSDRKRARTGGEVGAGRRARMESEPMDVVEDEERTQGSASRVPTPSVSSASGVEYVKIESLDERQHPALVQHHLHHNHHPHPHPHQPSHPLGRRHISQPLPLYTRTPLSHSHSHSQSELASDEDMPEAVTPSPSSSPPPSTVASTSSLALPLPHSHINERKVSLPRYPLDYGHYDHSKVLDATKPELVGPGVKMEDALLLLSFSHGTAVQ
ncbi:homeobox-domain-containing protein [Epithele typhae]|uniref:homeobox-domain-containing protein n=1 Tax=Epithele typhae TaxID=378194 RepID=UPI0020083AEF|nr:homeobox-domain-containing protein [Epithele typhae]KAH9932012.1 homeobox-domain-containing protein [Epithele typhae]